MRKNGSLRENFFTLHVFAIGSGIANVGSREANHLACVRRVGQYFLVTGHGSIKNQLAENDVFFRITFDCPKKLSFKNFILSNSGDDDETFHFQFPSTKVRTTLPLNLRPKKGLFKLFDARSSGVKVPFLIQIHYHKICKCARLNCA